MDSTKQKIDRLLAEEIDRGTFLRHVGFLLLAVFGLSRFAHLEFPSSSSHKGDSVATDTPAAATPSADALSAHAKAMAISSMRI